MGTSFQKQYARPSLSSKSSSMSQLRFRQRGRPSSDAPEDARSPPRKLRRSSTLSDTLTEARQSLRTTTDDLFLPRADPRGAIKSREEESLLQSAPLLLALLPALGGIFFEKGSVFLTDISLLALAAVFLNWSFRLPWYGCFYKPITSSAANTGSQGMVPICTTSCIFLSKQWGFCNA